VLCLIGESFDECSDEICGAVINIRPKGDKLGLWTRNATQRDANIKIGLVSHRFCWKLCFSMLKLMKDVFAVEPSTVKNTTHLQIKIKYFIRIVILIVI